jgi:hypothetical protein
MKKMFKLFSIVIAVVAITTACNKVPQAEIDATNAAVAEAKSSQADVYLPEAYSALMDSMNAVNEAIEAQKSKLFGRYGDIKVKLANYAQIASDLKVQTAARKEEIKKEVATAITEIDALIASNKELVAKAPRGKEGKAAIEAIESELSVIEGSTSEINSALASDDLLGALSKAKATKEKADAINKELTEVIEKAQSKAPKKAKK